MLKGLRPVGSVALAALRVIVLLIVSGAVSQAASGASGEIGYRLEPLEGGVAELQERFEPWQIDLLEMLNRRDRPHLARLDRIVVPEFWHDDPLVYSPFPFEYAWAADDPKALVVHQPWQVFAAYEHGRLVRWGPLSSGRQEHRTPAGLFHLNWRSPGRRSTVNPAWYMPWYYNFENFRGLSFHEHPLPGYPASHACVRLLERDARWIFDWGEGWVLDDREQEVLEHGTPVLIVGHYDFEAPPPWESVDWVARRITLPQRPRLDHHDPET